MAVVILLPPIEQRDQKFLLFSSFSFTEMVVYVVNGVAGLLKVIIKAKEINYKGKRCQILMCV